MFISDLLCISHQRTYEPVFFEKPPIYKADNKYFANEPGYTGIIPPATLRRMGKITRMGVATGLPLLNKHDDTEGIIIATANGGVDDSMKFLSQIEAYNEGTLTPTNFIQSTPNSLAGLLSMMSGNRGYNNTHVHEGLAFENALIDAQMFLQNNHKVLTGAAEEISDWNFNINFLLGRYKEHNHIPQMLLKSGTKGAVCGEGACMFILQGTPKDTLAQIVDVTHTTTSNFNEVQYLLQVFLKRNKTDISEVDGLILGYNGDSETDHLYKSLYNTFFASKAVFTFKNIFGEFPTASAFGLWLGVQILTGKKMPEDVVLVKPRQNIETLLIYNHYGSSQHGFILIKKTAG